MKKNVGDADRAARILVGGCVAIPLLGRALVTVPGIAFGAVAVYLLGTSLAGWCVFYAVMRTSTRGERDADLKS